MALMHIMFSEEEQEELRLLLEAQECVPIQCQQELSGVWYHSEFWDSELRILFLMNFRVTVSRVCFIRQRIGTMTRVLELLKHFCRCHAVQEILIQSVETKEMAAWCSKNGFTPDPRATFEFGGVILGDYIMKINPEPEGNLIEI